MKLESQFLFSLIIPFDNYSVIKQNQIVMLMIIHNVKNKYNIKMKKQNVYIQTSADSVVSNENNQNNNKLELIVLIHIFYRNHVNFTFTTHMILFSI